MLLQRQRHNHTRQVHAKEVAWPGLNCAFHVLSVTIISEF